MSRRIIQIAATSLADPTGQAAPGETLYALCDDGTTWALWCVGSNSQRRWEPLPPIPHIAGEP